MPIFLIASILIAVVMIALLVYNLVASRQEGYRESRKPLVGLFTGGLLLALLIISILLAYLVD